MNDSSIAVAGAGGRLPARGATLDLGDAGTPLRLLTAICCLGTGRFILDGSARMRQRPLTRLIESLTAMGIAIDSVNVDGCPPVRIDAFGVPGGPVRLKGDVSSQFLSALLMVGPCAESDLVVQVDGTLVSRPYVDLTIQVMRSFGARVDRQGYDRFRVASDTPYTQRVFTIEADASSASYFFAAAAVTKGRVRVSGIGPDSRQGDLRFLDLLGRMGCRVGRDADGSIEVQGGKLAGIDADLGDIPDVAPTLAAVALFAAGPTTLRGIAHLRFKESDRMERTAACARALGAECETTPDTLVVKPPPGGPGSLHGADIDPTGDHRLAMAFAVAGLAVDGVRILDPGCVAKSFPDFFARLREMTST